MERIYLYPMWLRIWHWSNAVLYLVLILSGISMHYAGSMFFSFNKARIMHNYSGILLVIMYGGYFAGNLLSGNIKHYIPKIRGIYRRLYYQTRFYIYGRFKGEEHPYHPAEDNKFNPLQQLTYLAVMFVLMPVLIVSGLFLMVPEYAPDRIFGFGGIFPMAVLHAVIGYFLSLFMFGHIYLATTGKTIFEYFMSMITGWHIINEKEK